MFKSLTRAGIVAAIAAGAMTFAPTAQARDRYHGRGGDDAAIAIGAGVVGLALGAAIASSGRDRYYDDGYYGRPRGYYYRGAPRYRSYYYDRTPRRYGRGDRYDRRGYGWGGRGWGRGDWGGRGNWGRGW